MRADLPAAWRGDELFGRADWLHELSAEETDALAAGRESAHLAARAAAIRDDLEHGSGAALVRGLPIADRSEQTTSDAFAAFASLVGTQLSQSAAGELVFHVRDEGYAAGDPRFRGPSSRKRLSFHTDRCDVIAFLCLQPAQHGGESFVVSSVSLYEQLRRQRPELLEVLHRPFPYLRHTVDAGNALEFCELPVFSSHEGHFAAHFLRVLIDRADASPDAPSLDEHQRTALDALEALAEDPAMHATLHLEPGDILLLNNWVTFHRRSEFRDASDPARRRHLLRIWLSMPNSRPIAPCFADHFGATAAGALRGGMRPA